MKNLSIVSVLSILACSCGAADNDSFESSSDLIVQDYPVAIDGELITEGYPEHLIYLLSPRSPAEPDVLSQNIAGNRLWSSGQTLRVCFYGGDSVVHELVSKTAEEWEKHMNLDLDFGVAGNRRNCDIQQNGISQIRVGFDGNGYWSAVGTDSARRINPYMPSMNLQGFHFKYFNGSNFTEDNVYESASEIDKGVIRHEFGHAIGLLHEHQNTNLNCWNELRRDPEDPDNVYAYYRKKYRWGRSKVERNLGLATISDPDAVSGKIDSESIMTYVIPATILSDGTDSKCYFPDRKNQISTEDAAFVSLHYPAEQVAIDDTDLSSIVLAAPPIAQDPVIGADYFSRIISDLESDDTISRRDARSRLADALRVSESAEAVNELFENIEDGSYRVQLGVVVALDDAKAVIEGSEIAESLNQIYLNNTDPTLRSYIDRIGAGEGFVPG